MQNDLQEKAKTYYPSCKQLIQRMQHIHRAVTALLVPLCCCFFFNYVADKSMLFFLIFNLSLLSHMSHHISCPPSLGSLPFSSKPYFHHLS